MINDFNCGISNLICDQKLMELGEITVGLEDV